MISGSLHMISMLQFWRKNTRKKMAGSPTLALVLGCVLVASHAAYVPHEYVGNPYNRQLFGFFNNFFNNVGNLRVRTQTTTTATTFTVTITNTCTRQPVSNKKCLDVPPDSSTANYASAGDLEKWPFPTGLSNARSLQKEMEQADRKKSLDLIPDENQYIASSIHVEPEVDRRSPRQLIRTVTITFTSSTTLFTTTTRSLLPGCSTPGFFVPC